MNDRDGDLVSFYRVLQNHFEEFVKQFKWLLMSRQWWKEWNDQLETGGLTDIQRAARYYYVQRQCFGGRVKGRTFGISADHAPRINLLRMEEELSEVHLRLSEVMIENLDYKDLIKRYDKPDNFFYLDPPYYKAPFYKHNLELEDFVSMSDLLKTISGKFICKYSWHAPLRRLGLAAQDHRLADSGLLLVGVATSDNLLEIRLGVDKLLFIFNKLNPIMQEPKSR